jgi:hypothetical protein
MGDAQAGQAGDAAVIDPTRAAARFGIRGHQASWSRSVLFKPGGGLGNWLRKLVWDPRRRADQAELAVHRGHDETVVAFATLHARLQRIRRPVGTSGGAGDFGHVVEVTLANALLQAGRDRRRKVCVVPHGSRYAASEAVVWPGRSQAHTGQLIGVPASKASAARGLYRVRTSPKRRFLILDGGTTIDTKAHDKRPEVA